MLAIPDPTNPDEVWLTEKEVSKFTGISVYVLQKNRSRRQGLPYVRITPRMIRYRLSDVIKALGRPPPKRGRKKGQTLKRRKHAKKKTKT